MIQQSHSLGIYLGENYNFKRYCTPMFISALFTIAKTGKQPKCPLTEEWIKEDVAHIYIAILFSYEKEWDYAICRNMDRPRDYHTKWQKSEKAKYHNTYLCNLENYTDELTYNTETDSQT